MNNYLCIQIKLNLNGQYFISLKIIENSGKFKAILKSQGSFIYPQWIVSKNLTSFKEYTVIFKNLMKISFIFLLYTQVQFLYYNLFFNELYLKP